MLKYNGKELKDFSKLESKEYLLVEGKYNQIVQVREDWGGNKAIVKLGDEIYEYEPCYFNGELFDIEIRVLDNVTIDDSTYSDSPPFSEVYTTESDMLEKEVLKTNIK